MLGRLNRNKDLVGEWDCSPERVIIGGGTRWEKRTAQMA